MTRNLEKRPLIYSGETDIETEETCYVFRCPYCNEILSVVPIDRTDDLEFINNMINNKIEEYYECPECHGKLDQQEYVPD